mgnify:FL=1
MPPRCVIKKNLVMTRTLILGGHRTHNSRVARAVLSGADEKVGWRVVSSYSDLVQAWSNTPHTAVKYANLKLSPLAGQNWVIDHVISNQFFQKAEVLPLLKHASRLVVATQRLPSNLVAHLGSFDTFVFTRDTPAEKWHTVLRLVLPTGETETELGQRLRSLQPEQYLLFTPKNSSFETCRLPPPPSPPSSSSSSFAAAAAHAPEPAPEPTPAVVETKQAAGVKENTSLKVLFEEKVDKVPRVPQVPLVSPAITDNETPTEEAPESVEVWWWLKIKPGKSPEEVKRQLANDVKFETLLASKIQLSKFKIEKERNELFIWFRVHSHGQGMFAALSSHLLRDMRQQGWASQASLLF